MRTVLKFGLPFLCAVLTPPLIVFAYFFLVEVPTGRANITDLPLALPILFFALAITALHLVLLGLPAVWLLKKLALFRWGIVVPCGFILGFIPAIVVTLMHMPEEAHYSLKGIELIVGDIDNSMSWWAIAQSSALVGMFGAVSASVFWLVWGYADAKLTRE